MVTTLQRVSNVLTKIMKVVIVVLFVWMVIALGVQVFARYLFHKGFVWTDESARYCMIWMIFLGATEIIFNDNHIKVTILEDLLRGNGRKILQIVQMLVGLVFSVMMVVFSFPQVRLAAKAVSSNMNINMGIVYAIFPVVSILMILAYLFRLILIIASFRKQPAETEGERL